MDKDLALTADIMNAIAAGDWGKAWRFASMDMKAYGKETGKATKVSTTYSRQIGSTVLAMKRYTAAINESKRALAESEDAELQSLYAKQKVEDAEKALTQAKKEHKKGSDEVRIATLELEVAEREYATAADKAKKKTREFTAAQKAAAKEKSWREYLKKLREDLKKTGDAATSAARKVQALSNPGTNSGGYREFAAGGVVTRPTFALVGEAGPEVIVPMRRDTNSLALLAQAMKGVGVASGGTTYSVHLRGSQFSNVTRDQVQAWMNETLVGAVRKAGGLGRR